MTAQTTLFDFVSQIREAEKYFDISLDEIERYLTRDGECEIECDHPIEDSTGLDMVVQLKMNIHCRSTECSAWTISIKLHSIRIDGIDFEPRYSAKDGLPGTGWHRHDWNDKSNSADKSKIPLPDFGGIGTVSDFLIRSMKVLRVRLNRNDNGTPKLRFD